jgi:Ca2+-binding EF-hand superfamily protein
MKLSVYLINSLLFASFSTLALDVKQRFDHLDANRNGYLTVNELETQPHLLKNFVTWDKDNDQQISLVEFKNYLTNNLY